MALLIVAPSGRPGLATRSDLIRMVVSVLEDRTDLDEEQLPPAVVEECAAAIPCLVHAVDPDVPFLLILTQITGADASGDRVSTLFVDTRTREVVHRTPPVLVTSIDETEALVARLFADLRPLLEAAGHWEPYGALEIEAPGPGFELFVDGTAIGVSTGEPTLLRRVLPRTRTVRAEHPEYLPFEARADVVRAETARVVIDPIARPSEVDGALRIAFFWTGAAAAIGGAVALIYATADTRGTATQCIYIEGHRDDCDPGSDFRTSRYAKDAPIDAGDGANPGGVLVAPLGYGLLGLGATWALSILFTSEDDGVPWIPLIAGVVAGAGAYGLSAALD
jgi:hypothetical protein